MKIYESGFGPKATTVKTVTQGKARAAFVPLADGETELIQSLNPSFPQSQLLQIHGQGIHHISLSTENIESELNRMSKEGVAFAAEQPNIGGHGVNITYTKPEMPDNITVRLCEESWHIQ